MTPLKPSEFLDTTRGRIVALLRRQPRSVEEIASALSITGSAVRGHLRSLERDGLIRAPRSRPGVTRPSRLYELTPDVEQLLSRAYVPLLGQLVKQFAIAESPERFDEIMREAGRGLARELSPRPASGHLEDRIHAAMDIMHRELGASTELEKTNSHYVIRGHGCPLAALSGKHPGVCHTIESLLAEMLGTAVHECCDRTERPRCCFEIRDTKPARSSRAATH